MDRLLPRRYVPAVAFAVLLLAVSLVPLPETGGPTPAPLGIALDKWVHAGSYAALTGLVVWGRQRRGLPAVVAVAVLVVGYGVGIELLQSLVPTRDLSPLDAVANTVGAFTAGLAVAVVESSSARAWWVSEQ